MKHTRFTVLSGCLLLLLFGFAATGALAQESVIRAEINPPDGTKINFSAPLSLLQTLKSSIPGQLVQDKGAVEQAVDELIGEFDSIRGKDLVRVEGPIHARIWVDEANGDNPEDLNFIQVRVKPGDGNQPEVQIRIPKGMIFLISCITDQFLAKYGDEIFSAIRQNLPHHPQPPMPWPAEKMDKDMKMKKMEKLDKPEKFGGKEMPVNPEAIKKAVLEGILKELKENLENEQ